MINIEFSIKINFDSQFKLINFKSSRFYCVFLIRSSSYKDFFSTYFDYFSALKTSCISFEKFICIYIYIKYGMIYIKYIYGIYKWYVYGIYIVYVKFIYIYGFHHWRIIWSSYRKLVWVWVEPTTTEFRSDALTDWAI